MRTTLMTLAAILTLSLSTAAMAQDREDPETTYDFEDDDVQGEYRSPLGESIVVRQGAGRVSLVRPRLHFMPELMKSVETI
ncbi:MAG: hypothetical protein H6719_10690 [Sandaracinaceae bacterium]|nr:hypothetical protein [Sandaracinaceae bacterium]